MSTLNPALITQEVQVVAGAGGQPGTLTIVGFDVAIDQTAIGYTVPGNGPLAPGAYHVAVYADTATITGDLVNPGCNLTIIAREIVIGATAILNTSGADVVAGGDYPPLTTPASGGGAAGGAGNAAGNLTLAADVLTVQGSDTGAHTNGRLASLNQALRQTLAGALSAGSPILAKLASIDLGNFTETASINGWDTQLALTGATITNANNVFDVSVNYTPGATAASPGSFTAVVQLGVASLTAKNSILTVGRFASNNLGLEVLFDVQLSLVFTEGTPAPSLVAGTATVTVTNLSLTAQAAAAGSVPQFIFNALADTYGPQFQQQIASQFKTQDVAQLLASAVVAAFLPAQIGSGGLCVLGYGGHGGRGQDGAAGATGKAGAAGQNLPMTQAVQVGDPQPAAAIGGNGGPGGAGGAAGTSGAGGRGGTVALTIATPTTGVGLTVAASGGVGGVPALCGAGGGGGPGGPGGTFYYVKFIYGQKQFIQATASAGNQGAPGANGAVGSWGKSGATTAPSVNGQPLGSQWPSPAASNYTTIGGLLPLCQLLLEQEGAKLAYLNAAASQQTGGSYADVVTFFNWIFRVTQQYLPLTTGTPAQKAMQAIGQAAQLALSRVAAGLDYFGNTSNWCPVLDYQYYNARVSSLLTICTAIQNGYNSAAASSNAAQVAAAKDAIAQLQATVTSNQVLQQSIAAQITKANGSITALSNQLEQQVTVVESAFNSAQQQFTQNLFGNACPFSEIVEVTKSLGQIASAVASAEADLIGSIKSIAENGSTVFKDIKNTISQVQAAEAEWTALQQAWQQLQADLATGTNGVILSDQQAFDSLMTTYFSQLPAAVEVEDDVNTLINLAQLRNQAMMNVTNLQAQWLALNAQTAQINAQIDYMSGLIAANNVPQLPEYLSFLQSALYASINDLIDNLYFMNQAYNYWTVSAAPLVFVSPAIAGLSATYNGIQKNMETWLQKTGRPFSNFQNIQVSITAADNPSAFALLPVTQRLTVQIPLDPDGPFEELFNVTAETVSVTLQGVPAPASGSLFVNLTQNGPDECRDDSGNLATFTHTPRPVPFEYSFDQQQILVTGTIGATAQGFNGLSPFATWILDFSATMNKWLDLTRVTGVTLTFSGYALGPQSRLRK